MSTITRLDDGRSCIAAEEISIAAIAAEAAEEYTAQAAARGMTVINRVTFSDPVRGNRSLMESVLGYSNTANSVFIVFHSISIEYILILDIYEIG